MYSSLKFRSVMLILLPCL